MRGNCNISSDTESISGLAVHAEMLGQGFIRGKAKPGKTNKIYIGGTISDVFRKVTQPYQLVCGFLVEGLICVVLSCYSSLKIEESSR